MNQLAPSHANSFHTLCTDQACRHGIHPLWCGTLKAKDNYISACERQIYLSVLEIREMSVLLRKYGYVRRPFLRANLDQEPPLWVKASPYPSPSSENPRK